MSIDVSPIFWKSDANLKKYDLESNFGGQVCALQKYFPIPFLFSKKKLIENILTLKVQIFPIKFV